jgi:hypothetical protein
VVWSVVLWCAAWLWRNLPNRHCHCHFCLKFHPLCVILGAVPAIIVQEEAIMTEFGPEDERLHAIYDRLDELDESTFETRAAELLHGLGFQRHMMARKTKDMSGKEEVGGQGGGGGLAHPPALFAARFHGVLMCSRGRSCQAPGSSSTFVQAVVYAPVAFSLCHTWAAATD